MLIVAVTNPIYNITPFTLLDYPGKPAAIVWFAGCNMRCAYCYNPDIVLGKGKISFEQALIFLEQRKGLLEGVVLSGGECTLHKDLPGFAKKIKNKNFALKIDTNGSNPDVLKSLAEQGLIDYVAIDFKAPPKKYLSVTGSSHYQSFLLSLNVLMKASVPFEVRTTFHSSLLIQEDIEEMCGLLYKKKYKGNLYVQHAFANTPTLKPLPPSIVRLNAATINNIPVIVRN